MKSLIFSVASVAASTWVIAISSSKAVHPFFIGACSSGICLCVHFNILAKSSSSSAMFRTSTRFGNEAMKIVVFVLLLNNEVDTESRLGRNGAPQTIVWDFCMLCCSVVESAISLMKLIRLRSQYEELGLAELEELVCYR